MPPNTIWEQTATLGQLAYERYGDSVGWKNYQGNPMPKWGDLTPSIQQAWIAAARGVLQEVRPELDIREWAQVRHALNYAEEHAAAGIAGHGQVLLLAKLANALGFV